MAWKLTVLVVLVFGTLSYLTDPIPGGDGVALQATAPATGQTAAKAGVSLVFEVPWGELEVPQTLAVLQAHGAKATFEADPAWVQAYPDLARSIRRAGHVLVTRTFEGDASVPAFAPVKQGQDLEERARTVAQEIVSRARAGATLRLPADDLSPATARALPLILERLQAQGLRVASPR